MNRQETGEFLYRFYRKRTASFLAGIYKASITGDAGDIHNARLDVKKIFALYGLFKMLDLSAFRHREAYKLFKPLYRQAGKIREMQVNCLLLENLRHDNAEYTSFIIWLREEEHRAVQKFLRQVKKFRESGLTATEKEIQKICQGIPIVKLQARTGACIRNKAVRIDKLLSEEPGNRQIHTVRKNLKSMSTIASLVSSIWPGTQSNLIIAALDRTGMMIGEWHDRLVLQGSVDRFLELNIPGSIEELRALVLLKERLGDDNFKLVQHFMPEVAGIVKRVISGENG